MEMLSFVIDWGLVGTFNTALLILSARLWLRKPNMFAHPGVWLGMIVFWPAVWFFVAQGALRGILSRRKSRRGDGHD